MARQAEVEADGLHEALPDMTSEIEAEKFLRNSG